VTSKRSQHFTRRHDGPRHAAVGLAIRSDVRQAKHIHCVFIDCDEWHQT